MTSITVVPPNAASTFAGGAVLASTTFSNTLEAIGATKLDSTLEVSGAATLDSTLAVTGAATLSDNLTMASRLLLSVKPQTLIISGAVTPNGVKIRLTAAAPIVLSSTPQITAGAADGQLLILLNVGSNTITFSDASILPGSGLDLVGTTLALAPKSSAILSWDATAALWQQIGALVQLT